MTVLDVLREGRKRIERGWTRGAYSRDSSGRECSAASQNAACWCAAGAIHDDTYYEEDEDKAYGVLWNALDGASSYGGIEEFNDSPSTTQSDILALYDRAIALAEKEET